MKRRSTLMIAIGAVMLVVLGGVAISAQDKYTVQVPGGLAFSEFRGYEGWQTVAISHTEDVMAVILANPVMIEAFKAGAPGNGKPFPDGAKMAKIHWKPKKSETFPGPTVPGALENVDFMVKDSKRFADSGGWGYAVFEYDAATDVFTPGPRPARHRRKRRQVRVRVPHNSEDKRLRIHGLREEVNRHEHRADEQ